MKAVKVTTENPELADRFNRVLGETVEALEESGIRYVFIGGIASGGLGRPRSTHDIDVFVRPEDAEIALRHLAKRGFKIEKTDPAWLYKGWKEGILVDVIFKSKGEIYLDSEMYQRITTAEFHGKQLRLVAPEDLVIIKAAAHSELTPGHWHDALALLSHQNMDWDYLIHRARRAPRRVLSLLLYAQSSDIWVPKTAIDMLYQVVFGDQAPSAQAAPTPQGQSRAQPQAPAPKPAPHSQGPQSQTPAPPPAPAQSSHGAALPKGSTPEPQHPFAARPTLRAVPTPGSDNYVVARVREAIAEDSRSNELDIQIEQSEGKILLRGEVMTEERREAVEQAARDACPGYEVVNQLRVANFSEPVEAEEITK